MTDKAHLNTAPVENTTHWIIWYAHGLMFDGGSYYASNVLEQIAKMRTALDALEAEVNAVGEKPE